MQVKRLSRFAALFLLVVLAFGLIGGVMAQEEGGKVLVTGRQMSASDIPTVDPAMAEDVPSNQIIVELFPSLLRLDEETVEVQPGMATYEVSEDGLVYTFSITPEIPWVRVNPDTGEVEQVMDEAGNPRYVTAQDFVYGMTRTLDPATAAPYQLVWAPWVAGGVEFASASEATEEERQALLEGLGFNIVDEYTLEVTVPRAAAPTPLIYAQWFASAQPQWVIEEQGDFWINPESINSYGPFAMSEWVRGDGGSMTIVKNPFWPGTETIPVPQLDAVQFRFLDEETQLTEFEAGNLHVAEAPASALDRITTDPNLSSQYTVSPGSCTYWYGFNVELPPFDDARARRAFSMAIDRQAIVENVTRGGEIPASFFALPSLVAAPTSELYPDLGIQSDPEAAQALWQEYLDETGQTADQFQPTLFYNESSLHAAIAQAVQQMWNETLGVNVQIAVADFATYLETRGDYEIFRAGWCFDYPDAHNFYYDVPFHGDLLPENDTHWQNDEFDALVDEAFLLEDTEARRDIYAQADNILVNVDAAVAPIYFYTTDDLTAPNVVRTHSLVNREFYEKWDLNE